MLSRRQKQHSQARNTGWDWLQMLHERKKPQVQPLFDHPHSEETLPQFCECWALGNSLPACVVYWYRSVAFFLSRKNKQTTLQVCHKFLKLKYSSKRKGLLIRKTWQMWARFVLSWMILYHELSRDQNPWKHRAYLEWSRELRLTEGWWNALWRARGQERSRHLVDVERDHPGWKRNWEIHQHWSELWSLISRHQLSKNSLMMKTEAVRSWWNWSSWLNLSQEQLYF